MKRDKAYWEEVLGKFHSLIVNADETPTSSFIIEWDYIGEGFHGDYEPDNPEDMPLLRFTVLVRNPDVLDCEPPTEPPDDYYIPAANGSFCTVIPVDIDEEKLEYFTRRAMIPKLEEELKEQRSIKGTCMRFSWTSKGDVLQANEGNIIHLTHHKEFFTTGAYLYGVEINGHKLLVVSELEGDTFCEGNECNDRVEKEYGL